MADISQIKLLDESTYNLKDATARSLLNGHTVNSDVPANAVFTDTKNTAGSTDTSSKIFLVGATSQAANPQTYSHDTAYVGTDGCLYSGGIKVLTAHQSLSGKLDTSLKGAANGLAELDANGKVPSTQLPSYVDDVLEYSTKSSFPATGETGKIYVDTTTNLTYRWSGSAYVEISASLALGTTSSTAFRGDYGNSAYTHAVTNKGSAFASGLYKITTNSEGHVTAATAVAKSDITALGIPSTNTTYESKVAASGGTDVSLVTTGEKYTWNNKGSYSKPSDGIPKTDLASAVQTSLGKADSSLQSHQTIKQDGVTGATVNRFGTCGTAAGTAAKTVDITTGTFALEAGARVTVKFTNANTAGTPTLNVNSKGAKNIFHKGTQITTGGNKALLAGTVDFVYDGTQWHLIGNYIDTTNAGTITGINMNGASKGTSGVVDLGTVITAHQDISGKADKSATVSTVAWDSTNKKITKTINGTTSDVVTAATILGNLTKSQVTTALGYTPPTTDTNTHRPIQVNGTEVLGNNTTALNLKAGSNVSVTNSSGTVTIAATDTTYSSKAAASGGTDVSLVTTGEKYTWNSKTSNTGTVTKVSTGVGLTGGDITGSGTVKAKLKSETASTLDSAAMGSTASRQYAVGVDKSGYLSVNIPWSNTTYSANTSKLVTTTVPNVTAAGSIPSLSYTARSVGSASGWSAGTVPTLGTAIPADDITAWTTNTPTSFSVSGEKLTITSGTAASLSYTAKSIPNVTSVGTAPSLTITTVACDDITAWNAGSAPTLGTAITVATGSLSSSGGGGTVATGITAS